MVRTPPSEQLIGPSAVLTPPSEQLLPPYVPGVKPKLPKEDIPVFPKPPKVKFFTGPQFEEVFGVRLPMGWDASYIWDGGDTAPIIKVYAPGGVELGLEDISISPTGEWLYGEGITALEAERQAEQAEYLRSIPTLPYEAGLTPEQRAEEEMYRQYQAWLKLESILSEVFITDEKVAEALALAGEDPDAFLDAVVEIGQSEDTEDLLLKMGLTEGEINSVFTPMASPMDETPQAVLGLEPEWMNVRTDEVITESEKAKRFPKGYEAELDEWVLTPETARNYGSVFKVFGEALTKLPKQWAAAILQAFQPMGASVVDRDWADRVIKEALIDQEAFGARVAEKYGESRLPIKLTDLAELPQSMAFSLTAMGAGLAVGVPTAFAPIPGARVAAWAAGTAASGLVAYNMSRYQIMQSFLELKNEEMKATFGREITLEEENQLKKDFSQQATAYGLWEAVPEALSNLAFGKILTAPLTKIAGKGIALGIIKKLGLMYGEELLTETITQIGQSNIEVEAGLREEKITPIEAFKEIFPQTFLLTTVLGGLGQTGVSSFNRIKKSLKKEADANPEKRAIYDIIKENITEDVFAEVEAESIAKIEEGMPLVEAIPEAVPEGVRQLTPTEVAETREEMGTLADYADDINFRAFLGEHTKYWNEATYKKARAGQSFKIYRAVRVNITDIHSGAWVTQSREYAQMHLDSVLRGEGHIIEGTATANDLIAISESEFYYAPPVVPEAITWGERIPDAIKARVTSLTNKLPADIQTEFRGFRVDTKQTAIANFNPDTGVMTVNTPDFTDATFYHEFMHGIVSSAIKRGDYAMLDDFGKATGITIERGVAKPLYEESLSGMFADYMEGKSLPPKIQAFFEKWFPKAKPPAVPEVKLPRVTKAEEARLYEMEAELGGLKEWLSTEPATKLVNLIKKTGWYKGEVSNLTIAAYKKITGKTPSPTSLTKDKKHVKWEYALDDVATEMGYESGEALKYAIEDAGKSLARIKELEAETARAEEPEFEVEEEIQKQLTDIQKLRQFYQDKIKTYDQTKAALVDYIKKTMPLDIRGKMLTRVKNVKTEAGLQKAIDLAGKYTEQNAQKVLKAEIHKELKKAQAKVKDHILKGKFTPEVQRRLDVVAHNLELDRDAAREKIADNITAYEEGKLGYEEMLNDNEMLNFAGIDGMSAEELAHTLEYIKVLETIGKSERQAKQERATERIKSIRSDISNILTGGQGLKTGIGAVPSGELVAKTGWWDAFTNWQYGIDNLADKLSKLDPTSKPYQSEISKFVAEVHRATHRQVTGTKVAFNKIKDITGEVYKVKGTRDINQILNGLEEEVNLGIFELTEEYKANHPGVTDFTLKMTRNQMIAKYMQMQDPTLNDTFTTGMGWSQKVRDTISNVLTAEEKKLANAIFGFYEDSYTATNPIFQELFNVDMPHNPNYSPIRRDFEADIVENVLTMRDASQYASVLNGSLKARQRNIRPLRFNGALDILSNHIQQMEHFKAWATTMRDMRRVFGNKEVRQAIEQYHGRGVLKLIDTFLNQMARGGIETATTNRAADFLRRNFTKSILAIKPVIMLKQIPSLFGYISEMNTVDFFTGIADYWTNPVTNFKFLYANSKMFKARMEQGFERDIRAAMQKHGKKLISGQGKFTDWFMLQIRLGDTFAVTQGMWAKYKAGLKEGLSQEEAIVGAEDTTGRTQPSFGIDTLSAIQNAGSWLKLMVMFQNQPNKYFRMEADALRNFKYGRGSRAKAASTILLVHCLLPMMFQYIADAFQWKPERQARAGILGPLNFILIGGQLVQSMWGWLTDQPFDYQVSPVAQTGRDLQMIFLKAKKLVEQGLDPYKDISGDDVAALIEYLAKASGQVLGLPTPYFVQLSKLIRHKFAEGEEIQIKDFLFSEWALQPPEKTAWEKVEDLNLKLGEPEEGAEDKPLTDKAVSFYDTADWFRDIGKVYDNVLPRDVLDDPKSSKESKAWAEYEISRSQADILPDIPLYKINTEDNADTIINYYEQWLARQRITSLAELKEFDQLYPKAYLGNVTRQQYDTLVKYLNAEDKDAFLEAHPGLKVNLRDEWLKANPRDNARLALGGQAKLLSMDAYNEFNKLIKELDIPDDAIPEFTLPPEGSIETHFAYEDLVSEGKHGSWEAQLLLLKDAEAAKEAGAESYAEWHDLTLSDTPVRALELKIKGRELSDLYDAYGDRDSPLYIESIPNKADPNYEQGREFAREKLKAANPEWVDDMRRIEAMEHNATDDVIEAWVERGRLVDEFGASSAKVSVWLLDNLEDYRWALDEGLLTDDGGLPDHDPRVADGRHSDKWNIPVIRINAEWWELDERYDYEGEGMRKTILINNPEYRKDRRRRDAYRMGLEQPNVDGYVDYFEIPTKGQSDHSAFYDKYPKEAYYEDDWWLMENKGFERAMVDLYEETYGQHGWKEMRDFSKVPTREVFELYKRWKEIEPGQDRRDFEAANPTLDEWLHLTTGSMLETEREEKAEKAAAAAKKEGLSKSLTKLIEKYNQIEGAKERLIFRHNHPELEEYFVSQGYTPVGNRWETILTWAEQLEEQGLLEEMLKRFE